MFFFPDELRMYGAREYHSAADGDSKLKVNMTCPVGSSRIISQLQMNSGNITTPSLMNASSGGGGILQNNPSLGPNSISRSPSMGYPSGRNHHSVIDDEDDCNGPHASMTIRQVNQVSSALRNANPAQRNQGSAGVALPSEKQLLQLVHQIQLAVQTGHLNAQVRHRKL